MTDPSAKSNQFLILPLHERSPVPTPPHENRHNPEHDLPESSLDSLRLTGVSAGVLLSGLVKPGLHSRLPVLAEMIPVEDVAIGGKGEVPRRVGEEVGEGGKI